MASTKSTNDVIAQDAPERKKRKRAAIIKFSFAGAALLGIGAAATSAAWTDDAWFSAAATTPTIQLQGGTGTPVVWADADTSATAIVIPSSAFLNLEPGVARQYTVNLKNLSTVPLIVAAPTVTTSGAIFTGANPAVVTTTGAPGTLAALTGTATVTVTVTPPLAWNGSATYQGKAGAITLQFQGASS
ncbi:hypothetical protein [Cellulomonas sp. ICMP 17802]|uniref:hypothetical protein n=1 Tax=Cellulomonas sp. ICMP 17802 TaxID=3239199 RepID=UPI00351BCEE6